MEAAGLHVVTGFLQITSLVLWSEEGQADGQCSALLLINGGHCWLGGAWGAAKGVMREDQVSYCFLLFPMAAFFCLLGS